MTPFARAFPWELMAYDFAASPWHLPQSTFASFSCGAFASAWQVTQAPVPWTEPRYAWRSTWSESVCPSGSVFSIVLSPWQSMHSLTLVAAPAAIPADNSTVAARTAAR